MISFFCQQLGAYSRRDNVIFLVLAVAAAALFIDNNNATGQYIDYWQIFAFGLRNNQRQGNFPQGELMSQYLSKREKKNPATHRKPPTPKVGRWKRHSHPFSIPEHGSKTESNSEIRSVRAGSRGRPQKGKYQKSHVHTKRDKREKIKRGGRRIETGWHRKIGTLEAKGRSNRAGQKFKRKRHLL